MCTRGSIVADVSHKFSRANDLPADLVAKGNFCCAEGLGLNPAQDKNFHLWIEVVFH
jgi:hypothetical protein